MDREPRVGESVTLSRNSWRHERQQGDRLVVAQVDSSDSTIKAVVAGSGELVDGWISWSDIEPARFGWNYIREQLPPDVVTILHGCSGIEGVALNRSAKMAIVATHPDLNSRILDAVHSVEAGNDDDDDDGSDMDNG